MCSVFVFFFCKHNTAYEMRISDWISDVCSSDLIKQIKAKTVTFGASDAPLKAAELDEAGLVQFPMVMGGIVPVVNLPGIKPGELVIDGDTLAKIFMGETKAWDDAALKKLNPGVKLTSTAIAVVHLSYGAGTD